ncbi:MAG: DUF1116 domain-containing protein [Betaproteobacteria bacterium]|nr:DUF1116 domain-containing protein [Betaproteobacteria bacterium]
MSIESPSANANALARIYRVMPCWTAVHRAGEALSLPPRTLLHAGPQFRDPRRLPPPMLNSAVLSCLYEGWAGDELEAERLIAAGGIKFEPSYSRRASTPLVAMISPNTTVVEIQDHQSGARWFGFLGTGAGPQQRFGARDPAILDRLAFRERELLPGFGALLQAPIDLLSIARSALTEGDDLHNRLSSATAVLHAVLGTRNTDASAVRAALTTVVEAPLYFLNLWMPACALMLDAAAGTIGSTLVTKLCSNGEVVGIQLAGMRDRWFTAVPALVQGPFMKGAPEHPQFPPATGDSGIIDAFGLGGQALRRAPSLLAAFAPWLAADDAPRALRQLAGCHTVLGIEMGLDAAAIVRSGQSPLLSTGMVSAAGRGLLGRGLCAMPIEPFADAMRAMEMSS